MAVEPKEPAAAFKLPNPPVQQYKRGLIKTLGLLLGLIVIMSVLWVMIRQPAAPTQKEEPVIFEHLKPKQSQSKVENTVTHVAQPTTVAANSANNGLLAEYFAEQALIKLREEDDARVSAIAFNVPMMKSPLPALANVLPEQSTIPANLKLVKAGSIIPCVLATAINSDLPGMVVARVREPVFDTATGKFLLIPLGAVLTGYYDNNVNFGQERAQIGFEQLDLPPSVTHPHGHRIQLDQASAYDLAGHAGIKDQVNNHYGKVTLGVSLSSLLAAIGKEPRYELGYGYRAVNRASDNVSEIVNKIADQYIKQSPTIMIKGGVPFNIIVAKDLELVAIGSDR